MRRERESERRQPGEAVGGGRPEFREQLPAQEKALDFDPTHDRLEDELWDERVGPDAMIDSEAELAELAAEARTTAAYLRWHLAGTTARHLIELADGIDRLLAERKELVAWWRYSSSPIDSAIVFQALHGGAYTGLPAPRWLVDASEKP
jgi:hypothetical protein